MDRVDFYYKQNVTQAELDQAFADPENADRAQSDDLAMNEGVAVGMSVTEDSPVSGSVLVSTGAAYDNQGRRVPVLLTQGTVDLSSLMPQANPRYVRIYAEFDRTLSDPRTDGDGASIDYRQVEEATLTYDAGTPAASPSKPSIDSSKVLLATILIPGSATTISDSDISMSLDLENQAADPDRQECGVLFKHGQLAVEDLRFDETLDKIIKGPSELRLKTGTSVQFGASFGGRYIQDIGRISMGQNDIIEVGDIAFDAAVVSDPALDLNNRNVRDVDLLQMHASGAFDPALDMNDRNIGNVDALTCSATGATVAISSNGRTLSSGGGIISSAGGEIRSLTGNIDSGGGNIISGAGDIDSEDGDIVARAGEFTYGPSDVRTQKLWLPASAGLGGPTYWTFQTAASFNRSSWESVSTGTNEGVEFPINLPPGAKIVSVAAKIYSPSSGSASLEVMRFDPFFGTPLTNPGNRTLLTEATKQTTTTVANYDTLQDTLSADHLIDNAYIYVALVDATALGVYVYGLEVEYKIETLKAGLH